MQDVDELERAIGMVAEIDLDVLSDAELHEVTVRLQRAKGRFDAAASRCVARWDRRQVWASDQSRSATARLAREVSCAPATARRELRRARSLTVMPVTAAAVASGRLSTDHLDLLDRARVTAPVRFADDEALLVEQCRRLRYPDAVRLVDYWRSRADPDGAEDAAARFRDAAHLHATPMSDGTVVVDGVLDPLGGEIVTRELDRLEQDLPLADLAADRMRTRSQRMAAALVEMATRSAATPAGSRRPRPLFTVVIGDDTFTHLCETAAGTVLTPGSLTAHVGTADLEVVLFDGPATVLSVSHRRRFTGALRRAIEVRDRHCRHPSGCDIPADACDVDHIHAYARGGDTSQFNGRLQCTTHNRHPDRHDIDACPRPRRPITQLDLIRARLRWQYFREDANELDDEPPTEEAPP